MKKIISLVLALSMVLLMVSAFADTAGQRVLDGSVSITNLTAGDKVTLYQVIEWDGFWKPTADFTAASASATSGLTQDDVDLIVGQNHLTGEIYDENTKTGLNDTYINKIIAVTGATAVAENVVVGNDGTYTKSSAPAGMYYAIVTPANSNRIYKPIFISADYNSENETNGLAVTAAKYETVTLEKESISQTNDQDSGTTYIEGTDGADSDNTAGIGDVIEFTLTTKIPNFPASFTNPIFKVSDSLTNLGLTVEGAKDIRVYSPSYSATNLVAADNNYTLTSDSDTAFTVAFSEAYINANKGKTVVVVYKAEVKNDSTNIIDNHDNTAKVNFSNNPDDKVGANEVEDHTEHYSFTINGDVWTQGDSTDIVKIGVDEEGKEIYQEVQLPNSHWIGALQNAKFSLYTSDAEGKKTDTIYKTFDKTIISGADGRFTISDLDAGTYWLVEEEAPAGYIKQQAPVKIEIIPVFQTHNVETQTKTVEYDPADKTKTVTVTIPSYNYAELKSYKILVDGNETASYSFRNDAITERDDDNIGETVKGGDDDATNDDLGKVKNVHGVELPSTGGIGTTIFYILGGLLVIGAAVILVARRKAHD